MQLLAFRIQNFRSIVDTGWHLLAHDNITSLIGQNESGKTSVLEALKAFHDGQLIEDMLRSDLSMPIVSCRFKLQYSDIENLLDKKRISPDIRALLEKAESISLIRKWEDDMDSQLLMGDELEEHYQENQDRMLEKQVELEREVQILNERIALATEELEKAGEEEARVRKQDGGLRQRISELKRQMRKFPKRERKEQLKEELSREEGMLEQLQESLKRKRTTREEKKDILDALKEKMQLAHQLDDIGGWLKENKKDLAEATEVLKQLLQMSGLYPGEKEERAAEIKEEVKRTEIEKLKEKLGHLQEEQFITILAFEQVIKGGENGNAMDTAREAYETDKAFYSSSDLAGAIFRIIPDFELFEDFSSLLPNRIDLEDIIRANKRTEGYKAAINFLTITGLDYSFFQQPSTRILKQKIENLNGELTLNFQDFWRQNVGKSNKIRINFELSHYDHTNPEKSGKPFIEFWIKDESERLYPKQRSRGVRWFLSFFLELKATAMDKSQHHKILLIDEPGVSLHARAQEDVLKVFDDIRDEIQIVYTTHSPHLVDENKLYRILAVQRAVENDMQSESLIYSAKSLRTATADTLSPIYASMGARLNQQDLIKADNNVIVKDLGCFYFLKAVQAIANMKKACHFLPASGAQSIPTVANILLGWGIDYLILNFDNKAERKVNEQMMAEQYDNKKDLAADQMLMMEGFPEAEDLLSTIDFKKHLVKVREGITVANSEYLAGKSFSRTLISSSFLQEIEEGKITYDSLDEESQENLDKFVKRLSALLK